jgi:hypothetical protein
MEKRGVIMSFEQVLDLTNELPLYEKEYLVNILNKRIIEDKRKELADYYKEIKNQFKEGKLEPISYDNLISELESELK